MEEVNHPDSSYLEFEEQSWDSAHSQAPQSMGCPGTHCVMKHVACGDALQVEGTPAALRPNRELCVLSNESVNNEHTEKSLHSLLLPSFHQVTQKASLAAEPAIEWKWEAANDVSCSSQRIAFPVKYLDNWLISLNVI